MVYVVRAMFEIVSFPALADENGWLNGFVVAVDGTPSIPFSVHKRDFDKLRASEVEPFLVKQAEKYIGMFGDGRNPRALDEEQALLPHGRI